MIIEASVLMLLVASDWLAIAGVVYASMRDDKW